MAGAPPRSTGSCPTSFQSDQAPSESQECGRSIRHGNSQQACKGNATIHLPPKTAISPTIPTILPISARRVSIRSKAAFGLIIVALLASMGVIGDVIDLASDVVLRQYVVSAARIDRGRAAGLKTDGPFTTCRAIVNELLRGRRPRAEPLWPYRGDRPPPAVESFSAVLFSRCPQEKKHARLRRPSVGALYRIPPLRGRSFKRYPFSLRDLVQEVKRLAIAAASMARVGCPIGRGTASIGNTA